MRDTLLIRARLRAALVSGPLALAGLAGLACGGPGGQAAPAQTAKSGAGVPGARPAAAPKPGRAAVPKTKSGAAAKAAAEADAEASDRPFAQSPYPERWGLDPYDPEAAEEEGCVTGDWCGSAEAARKFQSNTGEPDELGCPVRISHQPKNGIKEGDKTYEGLSFDPMMQGRLRRLATGEARENGAADTCCYHWFNYCSGRPLLGGGLGGGLGGESERGPGAAADPLPDLLREDAQMAPLVAGDAWVAALDGARRSAADRDRDLDRDLEHHLAAAWLADAQMEHASIAAFARATLELLAVGAPPSLVAGAQRAGLDEVEHARICFALAGRYGAGERGPGPLPAVQPRSLDVVGVAVSTFVEGCVGETIAALMATRAARRCEDATVRGALERIADDETRHAELAWSTVAWALGEAGRAGRGLELGAALRSAAQTLRGAGAAGDGAATLDASLLAAHGRLAPEALAEVRDDAWREIIGPMLATLLA